MNLYLLDGLARTDSGDVVEAADLEQDVFSVPGTIAHVDSEEKTNHQWRYDDIIESSKRMFLFREVGCVPPSSAQSDRHGCSPPMFFQA